MRHALESMLSGASASMCMYYKGDGDALGNRIRENRA